jgi:hypothetical protein
MATNFTAGVYNDYISNIEFAINFDTKNTIKIRKGDLVSYDGFFARHIRDGKTVEGATTSLRAAIASGWLTLKGVAPSVETKKGRTRTADGVVYKEPEYDDVKGGDFELFMERETDKGKAYISEDSMIVKETDFSNNTNIKKTAGSKTAREMEVVLDQSMVKDLSKPASKGFLVNSSTSTSTTQYNTRAVKTASQKAYTVVDDNQSPTSDLKVNKGNRFLVDGKSSIPTDGIDDSMVKELSNATVDYDQGGIVIGKAAESKPIEMEGITMRQIKSTGSDGRVKVSGGGSTPIMDLTGVRSQSEVNILEGNMSSKMASDKPSIEGVSFPRAEVKSESPVNYVDLLPENWGELHWTRKEKFIQSITDINFLKFILRVESVKAVINACKKQLETLSKK